MNQNDWEFILKVVTTGLAFVAVLQLFEGKKKRNVDMYWKLYEMYTSDLLKAARKNTQVLKDIFREKEISGLDDDNIQSFYSEYYHKPKEGINKDIDRSVIDRIRFINLCGRLLKMKLVDKDMLFELIGFGFDHDHKTLSLVLRTHRDDHKDPYMYNTFDLVMDFYNEWKKYRNEYLGRN
jgi:hypothetical protein